MWSDVFLMRNEVLLTIAAFLILCVELMVEPARRQRISTLGILFMAVITVVGFMPTQSGVLFGAMYQTNDYIALMKAILNVGTLVVLLQSVTWLHKENNQDKVSEYLVLIFSTLIGMDFMISSGHFLMFTLGLELATIPIAALAAFQKYEARSSEAGIKMLLLAALSSGVTLFGLSFLYAATPGGSLYFADVQAAAQPSTMFTLGFLFFLSGLAFKISLVPFHLWTADVYEGAPINISSYLSVISKAAASFILVIVLFTVFRSLQMVWTNALAVIAVLTMTIGNLFAIRQQNLKRFLAFSSIAQAGFLLLGAVSGSQLGMTSIMYFMLIYVFSNLGAFGVVSAISNQYGKEHIDDYNGLYRSNPMLSLTMMLSLFSLAGIPPAAGFFGKLFLFGSIAQHGMYTLLIIATVNATISLYYYLLVVKAMFIVKSDTPLAHFRSDNWMRASLVVCVAGILVIGFASVIFDSMFGISIGL